MNRFDVILQARLLLRREGLAILTLVRLFTRMRTLVVDERRLVPRGIRAVIKGALERLVIGMGNHMKTQLRRIGRREPAVGEGASIRSLSSMISVVERHIF